LFFASCAFGQGSVNITVTSGGSYVTNGVYVGPHTATLNGQSTQIVCDDFSDNSYINESCTAHVTSFANQASSTYPMWNPPKGPSNASTLYADAAWLATQMFKPASQNTNITEGYLAYTLWSLFNPNALTDLSPSQQSSVEAWLNCIPQGLTPSQCANFFIYTPDMTKSITCGGGTCPTAPPQEFLGFTVPEGGPALLYLLLAAVSCFGAIVLRHRRQANVAVRELT
jgi:hypothetical protein